MATLVLTAVGTAIGGPLGGALGSLLGSRIDGALFGGPDREGPRLAELKVTTSSYGAPIARHFGTMRTAGTIVWATDLKETREKSGGGKGQPSTVSYSYSSSFAVALASRPITRIGRIWADGNLLRGAAGDLKVQGSICLYTGSGDQAPDPLIAAAEGIEGTAFRGVAYVVFENLQLAEFGNRIPALTFEVVADEGEVSLTEMVRPAGIAAEIARPLGSLQGYSDEGGPLGETLNAIGRIYPIASDAGEAGLTIGDGDASGDPLHVLPSPVIDLQGESFGGLAGKAERSRVEDGAVPAGMRYYDVERDFQAGLQRASGRARPSRNRIIDFPGALQAADAKRLADAAATRAGWARDRLTYRVAELDPSMGPGQVVTVPGRAGKWRIEIWEWRDTGLELELLRLPQRAGTPAFTVPGRVLAPPDLVATPTVLAAFELPWNGIGSPDARQVFAAASSAGAGWTGAALYAETGGALEPVGNASSRRSVTGKTATALPPSASLLLDRHATLDVQLVAEDFALDSADIIDLAAGANRALVGAEIIQFALATNLGGGRWRLAGLLRGRGGTEHLASKGCVAGVDFVLLDDAPVAIDPAPLGAAAAIAAIGLADQEPVRDAIGAIGTSLRPLAPVHARITGNADGDWILGWIRRARGAWTWSGTVDLPLVEQGETYEVGVGDPDAPQTTWQVNEPLLTLTATEMADLRAAHPGATLWVRQVGTHARSLPLLLITL